MAIVPSFAHLASFHRNLINNFICYWSLIHSPTLRHPAVFPCVPSSYLTFPLPSSNSRSLLVALFPKTLMAISSWTIYAAFSLVLVWVTKNIITERRRNPRRRPPPPGPRSLPILGNVLQIPQEHPWIGYNELCRQYGARICHLPRALLTDQLARGYGPP